VTKPWPLFTVLVLLLFVGTLMPGSVKAQVESQLWGVVPWSSVAHFALFAAIAALPVYGSGRGGVLRAVVLALLLATITESMQSMVPGRHPLLRDALIDLAGTFAGLTLRSLWLARMRQTQLA
jgi:hypothetical protein